jgi:hypothetical protein
MNRMLKLLKNLLYMLCDIESGDERDIKKFYGKSNPV